MDAEVERCGGAVPHLQKFVQVRSNSDYSHMTGLGLRQPPENCQQTNLFLVTSIPILLRLAKHRLALQKMGENY